MSKLFFDSYLDFSRVEKKLKESNLDSAELAELWDLVDEIIHRKVFDLILGKLPAENHKEFIEIFHKCPHDEVYIVKYLEKKTDLGIVDYIRTGLSDLENEILSSFEE